MSRGHRASRRTVAARLLRFGVRQSSGQELGTRPKVPRRTFNERSSLTTSFPRSRHATKITTKDMAVHCFYGSRYLVGQNGGLEEDLKQILSRPAFSTGLVIADENVTRNFPE